jgi:hypothetical protein
MTNAQLYFAIGLPCVTIISSLIISLVHVSSIHKDIREIRDKVKLLAAKFADLSTRLTVLAVR